MAVAALMVVAPVGHAAAQSSACPITSDSTVSQALGTSVTGALNATVGSLTLCSFGNFGVSEEAGAFGPGEGGAAALATRYIPVLPQAAKDEISALNQVGLNVATPDYQLEAVTGLGDAALWARYQLLPGFFRVSLLVQRGGDAFSFDGDDSPGARTTLTSLAQAVLAQPAP